MTRPFSKPDPQTSVVDAFSSVEELARYCDPFVDQSDFSWEPNWVGETRQEAMQAAINGDESAVAASEDLLAEVDAAIDTPKAVWKAVPAGDFPIVADVLAGRPYPMRRKFSVGSGLGPVRIYADLVSSQGIHHSQLVKRGNAILALASKLSAVRPVELFGVVPLGVPGKRACIYSFAISASPLNLAVAAAGLTHGGIVRGFAHKAANVNFEYDGSWAWQTHPRAELGEADPYRVRCRKVLDLNPEDLYIPPPFHGDPIAQAPLRWIQENLNRLQGGEQS